MKNINLILILMIISIYFLSCEKEHQNQPEQPQAVQNIQMRLEDISSQNCINLEKVSQLLDQIENQTVKPMIRQITTNVEIVSEEPLQNNFLIRMSYGFFKITDASQFTWSDFKYAKQNDCESLTLDQQQSQIFKVDYHSLSVITLKGPENETYTLEWISENHFKISHGYETSDILCDPYKKVFIQFEKDFNWNKDSINRELIESLLINANYLQNVTKASGASSDVLYRDDPQGNLQNHRFLSVAELKKLSDAPLQTEFLNCN